MFEWRELVTDISCWLRAMKRHEALSEEKIAPFIIMLW